MGYFRKSLGMTVSRWFGLSSADFMGQMVGQGISYSGRTISPSAALKTSTVWACVRLLAETAATLPVGVYELKPDGTEIEARDHPLDAILRTSPNYNMTAIEFWTCIFAGAELTGNGYGHINRTNSGRVISVDPMNPERTKIRFNSDGTITYLYNGSIEIDSGDVLHVKNFSTDGYVGLSTIQYGMNTIGNMQAMEEVVGTTSRNGLTATGYLTRDTFMKDGDRERLRLRLAEYEGTGNAGKTMLLEGGWKYNQISIPAADAQLLDQQKFGIEEVCRAFGVPPWMVGHTDKTTSWGTGVEQQGQVYLTYALRKRLQHAEQQAAKKMLSPADRQKYLVRFNMDALLRADSAGRAAFLSTMVQNGIYTRNEARKQENLPPVEGGDILTVGSNMLPIEKLGETPPGPSADGFGLPKVPAVPPTTSPPVVNP